MNRRHFLRTVQVAATALTVGGLAACSNFYYGERPGEAWFPTNLIDANHRAVDA